jgi:hypothetical protein
MILVDRSVVGEELSLGEEEAGHGLTRGVHKASAARAYGSVENIESRHEVVVEHDVRRIVARLRDRRGVDYGIHIARDRKGVSRIGEIGLEVLRFTRHRSLEYATRKVRGADIVAAPLQCGDGRGSDLPSGSRHEHTHEPHPFP